MFGFSNRKLAAGQQVIQANVQSFYDEKALEEKFKSLVSQHMTTLVRKRNSLLTEDDYGVFDKTAWSNEICKFYVKVILPTLTPDEAKLTGKLGGPYVLTEWVEGPVYAAVQQHEKHLGSSAVDVEKLDPLEYERYCAAQLETRGWTCKLTPRTGDQGADILAIKGYNTLAVQCKKYSSNVGNTAVQEVIAAKLHFRATHAAVVTNAGYTTSAKQLANTTKTMLLNHAQLAEIDSLVAKFS